MIFQILDQVPARIPVERVADHMSNQHVQHGFEEPKSKKEREELRKKLNQHKNEINNPCIKVGMRGCNIRIFRGDENLKCGFLGYVTS